MSDVELSVVKSEITKVAFLTSESIEERWKIWVKVLSKSSKLRLDDGTQYFKVVLEDDSGQIDAFAFGGQNVLRFFDRFEEDKIYFISDGNLVKKSRNQPIKEKEDDKDKVRNVNDDNASEGKIETEKEQKGDENEGKVQNENEGKVDKSEGKEGENEGKLDENEGKDGENVGKVDENEGKDGGNEGKLVENVGKDGENVGKEDENEGKVDGGMSQNENELIQQKVDENEVKIDDKEENEPKKDVVDLEEVKEDERIEQNKEIDLEEEYVYEIHLESGTIVTCQEAENKPRSPFTPITQLRHVNKTFVDVVGIVTGVWKLEMKYTQYRSINITDENGCDVNVALWGKMATDFDVKCIRTVVSLKHVRVKKENGDAELQSTPRTELDYKPAESEAVVLREILGLAEDHTDVETDTNHCTRRRKRRGSYSSSESHSNKRTRYNSGGRSGKAKSNRNNSINGAMCRRRRNKQVQGRTGRKIYIRKRNSTRDYFKSDGSYSDLSDSLSEEVKEVRGRRRPVRHCQSLYSDNRKKRRVPSSSDDDTEDSDDDDDFTSDDDTDTFKKKVGKKNGKGGRPGNKNIKDTKQSSQDFTKKDDACSSQGLVTAISIQTDDESEMDSHNAKQVLPNKKERKGNDSDSDATVSYLEGKHSGKKPGPGKKSGPVKRSGPVRKNRPVRRRKKESSDDDSSSDDSSSDDSDGSDDDDDDDKTDDGNNEKASKKSSSEKTKVASSKKKARENITDDDNTDSDKESDHNKKKNSNSLKKNLRKRGPIQKKKQSGLDNEADEKGLEKTNDDNNEKRKPSGRKIKTRPRRNIVKKTNNFSDTDDETDDDVVDKANGEYNSTRKESNAVGSSCKQRISVKDNKEVGKAKSNGEEKSESTKELPRIRLILRKTKKKVSYTEADDKASEESKSSGRLKTKKGNEEKNETESPKSKPATRRSLSKQKSNVSEEGNEKDLELEAFNMAQTDSRTRRSMRTRKNCDYDEGKDETINDGDDEKGKDSPVKNRASRRSCRKKINFTDDENEEMTDVNEEMTDESDNVEKQGVKPKTRSSSQGKRKSNVCDERGVETSEYVDESTDLKDSDKKNMKTRSTGHKKKSLVSDLDADIDEDDLDDFDLVVETTCSAKKNSEQKENGDVKDTEVDDSNTAKPKARRRPGRPKRFVSDDEGKSCEINGEKDLIEESPLNHHSLRKRKAPVKKYDEDIDIANGVDNAEDKTVSAGRRFNTRRTSGRQKTKVTDDNFDYDDDDDDFQDKPVSAKKYKKSTRSARKKKKYCSSDENEGKEDKENDEVENPDLMKNMSNLRVVIGKLEDDMSNYSRGTKNDTDEEDNENICKADEGNDDKPNDEVENDDENAGKRQSTRSRSAVKRRQICSDDEGDEKPHTEYENDKDNESKSDKKKFKRIKPTYTSSQETVQSVDPEDDVGFESEHSGNESETSNCNSKLDNKDKEDGTLLDSAYIEQLREFQKDDNGTVELLQHYILWFAMKAGGENLDEDDFQETIVSKNKLDARLEVVMNICQSQAWGADFRADVMAYPEFNDDVKHSDLKGGDMRYLGNCQVCNRENHPWSVIVKLEGEPYDRESYQMRIKEEGESSLDLPAVEYYMGCFCHPRTKLFHNLYHFGHALYHKCKKMLEDYDNDEEKIDKVATDRSLFEEMYTKLKKFMKEVEEDYTEDGERGNNKWTREYNW